MTLRVALLSRAVHPHHGHGGLERHVAALAKYLGRAGCDVAIYTTPPSSPGAGNDDRLRVVRYRIVPWPDAKGFVVLDRITNYLLWSRRAAGTLLERGGFDIVQADGAAGFGYARRGGKSAPPLVLHPHGMEEFEAPPLKRALYAPLRRAVRTAARGSARVLAPDASMRAAVERHLGVEPARIRVMPNAIDLEEIDGHGADARVLAENDVAEGAFVLLSVGRLEANKGFDVLARALASARSRLPPQWCWVLAGRGPARDALERTVRSLALGGAVRFTGAVSDEALHALYRRADLFVHPTLYEGSSLVTLEAMAHAKAIVATRVGGIPDKIAPGRSGRIVPPRDVEALAEAVVEAAGAEERRREWGRQARRVVEERFSWSRRQGEIVALYEDVLRERGGSGAGR